MTNIKVIFISACVYIILSLLYALLYITCEEIRKLLLLRKAVKRLEGLEGFKKLKNRKLYNERPPDWHN